MSDPSLVDRRTFLVTTSLAASSWFGGVLAPRPATAAVSAAPIAADTPLEGSGHIDDACGHWPPYSHQIPYGHVPVGPCTWNLLDPIDHLFMI